MYRLMNQDCREAMRELDENSVDSIVTDPPYGLGFMGKKWDNLPPGKEVFEECLRVLKPGGYLLAFGGSRTYHRLAVAVEDAGFEIRDQIMWIYGSGFPKSQDVSKAIDKKGGNPHLSSQIGKAIKKAREDRGLTVSECDRYFCGGTTNWSWFEGRPKGQRPPSTETFDFIISEWPELESWRNAVAEVEREVIGKGESGIGKAFGDGQWESGKDVYDITAPATESSHQWQGWGTALKPAHEPIVMARKPLKGTVAQNVLEYGTGAVNIAGCRVGNEIIKTQGGDKFPNLYGIYATCEKSTHQGRFPANVIHDGSEEATEDMGKASRYFYCAKASKNDRTESEQVSNKHPTVKPTELMCYLCRLITQQGGIVLDPFMGSGSTGKAAILEGFQFIGIDSDKESVEIARNRIECQQTEADF